MSDEKVIGLPELPEGWQITGINYGNGTGVSAGDVLYTADQMHQYARDALSAHGLPVVDESAQPAEAVDGADGIPRYRIVYEGLNAYLRAAMPRRGRWTTCELTMAKASTERNTNKACKTAFIAYATNSPPS